MTALAVSPNKRYAAVAETKAEKPNITIFDLTTLRRRKVLVPQETTSQAVISLAFSPDSKYLISQLSNPDWILTYWHWEKGKAMASVKSNGATSYHVKQVESSYGCCTHNAMFIFHFHTLELHCHGIPSDS